MYLGPGRLRSIHYHYSAHRGSRADHLSFFTITVVADYILLVNTVYHVLYFRATAAGYGQ